MDGVSLDATVAFGRPGAEALEWLAAAIGELKGADPLAPVAVVAPNLAAGRLALRRVAGGSGYVNVTATRLGDLAAEMARPLLAGRQALTPVVELAAARAAACETPALRGLAGHLNLAQALTTLFRELRRREIEPEGWREAGAMAQAAAEAYGAFRRITAGYVDATEVRKLALQGAAKPEPVVLFLPTRLDPADVALLAAIAARAPLRALFAWFEGDELASQRARDDAEALAAALHVSIRPPAGTTAARPDTTIVRAPDQREEVREVVRAVLAAMEGGTPLHRMAILYRQPEAYASLVADTLDLAGLPWCSLSGASLLDSRPGQALLELLRLPERSFGREAVLRLASALPYVEGRPPAALWDRLSREANVVRGAGQWIGRLRRYADAAHGRWAASIAPDADEEPEPKSPWFVEGARRIADTVEWLEQLLRPPADGASWAEFAAWAEAARQEVCGDPEAWPGAERPFAEGVRRALASLADAGEVEPRTSLAVFLASLEHILRDASRPAGRLGQGILTGPVQSVAGMAFDQVFVVGLTEGAFPAAPAPNPFFPSEANDVLRLRARFRQHEREAFQTALASAGTRLILSTPQAADGRAAFPSRWLLEIAAGLAGQRIDASAFGVLAPGAYPWLRALRSAGDGLASSPAPLSLDEHRLAQAIAWRQQGHALAAHPLARQPVLERALAMAQARRARRLTAFDGNLSAAAAGARRIARLFDEQRAMSATGLQSWASCPFSFFLERVIDVHGSEIPEDRWTIDAAARGSLIHAVLEEFLHALAGADPPLGTRPYTEADRRLLRTIAERRFEELRANGLAGNPLIWEATAADIWADLEMFLREDQAWRADHGWQPARFEQRFGYDDPDSWPALEIEAAGVTLRFRGQIDRIDVSGSGRAQLYDYKTGKSDEYKELGTDPVSAGRTLQLALYSEVVQRNMPGASVGATYWFVSTRGGFAMEGLTQPPDTVRARLGEALERIASGIRGGVFPAVPGEEDDFFNTFDNCRWCAYERVCPKSREEQWARKRDDPACAPYTALALPGAAR
jgi:RecB family exonuclease